MHESSFAGAAAPSRQFFAMSARCETATAGAAGAMKKNLRIVSADGSSRRPRRRKSRNGSR